MTLRRVEPDQLVMRPFYLLDQEWAILVGGKQNPNPMTVSWGGFGTLWNRPVVTVYVRPTRYTYSLLNNHDEFTLNIMPPTVRAALDLCGSASGRDVDKWKAAELVKEPSEFVGVPRVAGADLSLECKTLHTFDLDPARFLDGSILGLYPQRDYHRAYIGEVVCAWAAARFTQG